MMSSDHSARAGRYVRQPNGYLAFMPAQLPPPPPISLEGELQHLLSQADWALGRLDGSIQTLPHPDLFVAMYVRKEAVFSSRIESTQSSLQDVLAAEARVFSPNRPSDVEEVFKLHRSHELRPGSSADATGVGTVDPRDPRKAIDRDARTTLDAR